MWTQTHGWVDERESDGKMQKFVVLCIIFGE